MPVHPDAYRSPLPQVLHVLNVYLNPTETFIWQYLRQAKQFQPLILADHFENLDRFPLPGAEFLQLPLKRPAWKRAWAGLRGRYAQGEYLGLDKNLTHHPVKLCHVHNGYRACVARDFLLKSPWPFLLHFYGYDLSHREMLRRAKADYQILFKKAAGLLVEGPAMRQRLLNLGAPEHLIRLQPLAIDPSEYPFRARNGNGDTPVSILFVGRLVEKKGLEYGLEALARVKGHSESPPFKLTVVGDGPLLKTLKDQCARLGLNPFVDFRGYQTLSQMRSLMEDHDLFLAPSCTARDGDGEGGAPTVLLEAAACGMPILATSHDDIPFVTRDGISALLSPEREPEALAKNLKQLMANPQQWSAMGRAGRAHIEHQHNIHQQAAELENYYRSLL